MTKTKVEPLKINEAVRLITTTDKGFSGKKTGQPFKKLELSGVVEQTGQRSNRLWQDLLMLSKLNH